MSSTFFRFFGFLHSLYLLNLSILFLHYLRRTPTSANLPSAGPPSAGRPKISLFFFPLPPQLSFFLPSFGGLLVDFWWCSEHRSYQMCTLGLSGCRVKPLHQTGPPGLAHDDPGNSKRAFCAPALQTPLKFNGKTPREHKE